LDRASLPPHSRERLPRPTAPRSRRPRSRWPTPRTAGSGGWRPACLARQSAALSHEWIRKAGARASHPLPKVEYVKKNPISGPTADRV